MLEFLTVADALAIAEASARRSRDERAMVDYLGIGRRTGRGAPEPLPALPLLRPGAIDLAAFESEERRDLAAALERLAPEARRELVALVFLAKSPASGFAAALRRARRIPPAAQLGYLMGRRLERAVPAALETLGLTRGA